MRIVRWALKGLAIVVVVVLVGVVGLVAVPLPFSWSAIEASEASTLTLTP